MKYKTTFEVTGRGEFPIDMLRYDCCFPNTGSDSAAIMHDGTRTVSLVKYHADKEPLITDARWNSFGWGVGRFLSTVKL